jgi:hypothetical protein
MDESELHAKVAVLEEQVLGLSLAIIYLTRVLGRANVPSRQAMAEAFQAFGEQTDAPAAISLLKSIGRIVAGNDPKPGPWLRGVIKGGKDESAPEEPKK